MVGSRHEDDPAGPQYVVVFKGDSLEPMADVAPEGNVTFVIQNASSEPHDFALVGLSDKGREPFHVEQPLGEEDVSVVGRVMGIEPGGAESVRFPLERGRYLMVSNTPGRYLGASLFELTVQPVQGEDEGEGEGERNGG
ncbi:MAG: hypothetical protein M0R73_06240 [Dehalococcoidia bacterium]|nr:hypothetical protein [Dehalococcoidia bacterium]